MRKIAISATNRAETGKGPNRRLRQKGLIPAIMYGRETEPVNLSVCEHDFVKAVSKLGDEAVLYDLTVEGSSGQGVHLVMLSEAQRDPVTDRFVHLDLKRLQEDQPVEISVPIHSTGLAVGVRLGGTLKQVHRSLKVRCLPSLAPSELIVDVSEIGMNQSLYVSDLDLAEGVETLVPETETLFLVAVPRLMASAAEAVEEVVETEEVEGAEADEADEKE